MCVWVCVCVCVSVCVCVCVSVRSFLPPRTSRPRNIGSYVFSATWKKTFTIVIFAKNAWFRSYGIICFPRMPPTTLNTSSLYSKHRSLKMPSLLYTCGGGGETPNDGYQRNQLKAGKSLVVVTLKMIRSEVTVHLLTSFVRISAIIISYV